MDEAALRDWVVKRCPSFRKLPAELQEKIWQDVKEEDFVATALDPDLPDAKDELVKKVERIVDRMKSWLGRPSPRGRTRQKEITPVLRPNERARAEAFSVYIAKHAATTALVRRFRRDILQGAVLSQEQAIAFLTSPASQVLAQEQFEALGIPLVGHNAQVTDHGEKFRIDEGAEGAPFLIRTQHVTLQIEWPGGMIEETFEREIQDPHPRVPLRCFPPLLFLDSEGKTQHIVPWEWAILSKLGKLSRDLAQRYRGLWTEAQATMFVLTDVTPFIASLQVSIRGLSRVVNDPFPEDDDDAGEDKDASWPLALSRRQIILTVDAWVSDDTVLRAYKAAQHEVLKRDNRQLGERAVALVRFLVELEDCEKMTGDARMAAWNRAQTNPDWQYDDMKH